MSRLSEKYGAAQVAFLLAGLVALRAEVENDFDGEANPHADDSMGICWNVKECYIDKAEQFPADLLALHGHDHEATRDGLVVVWFELRDELFQQWPEFSGNRLYPVPGIGVAYSYGEDDDGDEYELSGSEYSSVDAEETFDNTGNMWEGEYGEGRVRLLSYMIDQLTKESVGA
ncbi:hypothetical protein IVIADoCa2_8 [Xanthomonas phage vB_Xar_IVIA-DoCa2]|uniref:Uncharacterized protein n=1 Tax=Xanthomonas phage vB_Xar_IVIA-DoCa2 TaxID=2970491 RepID=A0A976SGW0_9CAUD|nr:hypothetical protein IVIADoCa2_8 [Xanthomonas phage vB_Xar_IVIA-DoCa2]